MKLELHSKSDNLEIMMGSQTEEIIEELFESLLQRYQEGLEESMKGSEFIFDSINSFYYKRHTISLNRGGSYIDSPEWLKNKKATINPKINDDKYFQYALTVALNYPNIKNNLERLTKIKLFINQYNWKELNFHHIKKTGESLNQMINQLLLIFCMYHTILKKKDMHTSQNII